MGKFIEELKRRNVLKSALAYLVVAWVLIQVFTTLLPIVDAPEWILKGLTFLLAIGLPIWIVVSWIYNLSPEGITKTTREADDEIVRKITNKRLNAFLIAGLSLAVIVMGLKIANVFDFSPKDRLAIAVMPFVNISGNPEQEYFSDGLSEELINRLALTPQLKVIGRTSSFAFKGTNVDLREIGEMLGAAYLLEGSVRWAGNKIRITTQLVNSEDGFQLFSSTFERELKDIFAVQDEIAMAILDAIKIKLLKSEEEAFFRKYTENNEAYQLYLKGRYFKNRFTRDALLKAIEYYDQAIAIDPSYAIAYAEKSFCYTSLRDFKWLPSDQTLPQGLEAAERSIALDDNIAESQLAIGRILLHYRWNVRDALAAFRKAVSMSPNNADAHVQIGFCLTLMGRHEEAVRHARIAEDLDPLSPLTLFFTGVIHNHAKDFEAVLSNGQKLIELEPNFYGGHLWASNGYFRLGRNEDAMRELELAARLNPGTFNLGLLAWGHAVTGDKERALELTAALEDTDVNKNGGATELMICKAALNDLDAAFHYFDMAIENRENMLLWEKMTTWSMEEFTKDPRYAQRRSKMNIIF
ncbi:MAG: tetratricopeptide repeat protein [Robiginitalea sp.]